MVGGGEHVRRRGLRPQSHCPPTMYLTLPQHALVWCSLNPVDICRLQSPSSTTFGDLLKKRPARSLPGMDQHRHNGSAAFADSRSDRKQKE